jgi:RNA-directed DNA polymerase
VLIVNVNQPEIPHGTEFTDKELANRWRSIDWKLVQETVNNLQLRIARAAKEGKWYRVYKLSRLLTNSYHAKLIAVRTVTSNKGGKTPGIDGVTWKSPADKMRAALSLSNKGYHAKPLKRIYILKKNGKLRPLSIPTLKDRAMHVSQFSSRE